jgi:hypothetical protein
MNNFSKLEETKYMFEWFCKDPFDGIFNDISKTLSDRVEGTQTLSVTVKSPPDWLTAVKPKEDDPDKSILTRAGVAFEVEIEASSRDGQMHLLTGIFSWVGLRFDGDFKHLLWFDLGVNLETHGKDSELLSRIYSE